MRVLAGDIGGTNARLAIFRIPTDGEGRPISLREETYASVEFDGLSDVVRRFLDPEEEAPEAACFAIAGPVTGRVYRLPNLNWEIRQEELAGKLEIEALRIINDFDAVGHGLAYLAEDELATLQSGQARERAPIALIGAGTGLGMGYLTWHDGRYRVNSSEGGHADFTPRGDLGCDLLAWLAARHGHASWERVLSGPGLVGLYEFLRERGEAPEREEVRRQMEAGEPARVISAHALRGSDPLCERALDIFVSSYGVAAGDVALILQAEGGLFLAGGIAPAILPKLREGPFLDALRDKGRFSDFMRRIPVKVILNTDVGLLGAAGAAVRG